MDNERTARRRCPLFKFQPFRCFAKSFKRGLTLGQLFYIMIIVVQNERVLDTRIDAWLSLVERCVRDAEVAGSNPVASTIRKAQ